MAGGFIILAGAGLLAMAVRAAVSNSEDTLEAMGGDDIDLGDDTWALTLPQFRDCFPNLSASRAAQLYESFIAACYEVPITTRAQLACFIAQLGHESMGLTTFTEFASGAAYENRVDLGNTAPGDGIRYKGRGAIMITGRANYREAGRALSFDLELSPEQAAADAMAFRVAAWFWRKHDLNDLADERDFTGITRAINGGTRGLADRQTRLINACRVLGITSAWT